MKCVIPGGNVKVLAKAIHMMAKIGDEMYVHPQEDCISFRTLNMAKSAYSDFTFRNTFFSYYSLGDLDQEESQKCKISMRSAMTVFKSAHTLDKQVETCHICLEADACELMFILKYKNGVNKSHLAPILNSEKLQASYNKGGMPNELTSQARMLADALQNFQQNLTEITLEITKNKLLLRNYVDDTTVITNTTRTQLALGVGEFDRYIAGSETIITFCMKEFRALLAFSETVGVPVCAQFETTGKPVLFILKNQGFEANLLLATLSPDTDSQSDASMASRSVQPVRRKQSSRGASRRANASSTRMKKSAGSNSTSVSSTRENGFTNPLTNTTEQTDRLGSMLNEPRNNSANATNTEVKTNISADQGRLFVLSPADTSSSTGNSKTADSRRKLLKSVFSSMTKRKSTDGKKRRSEDSNAEVAEYVDLEEESVSNSPPRRVAKKARTVFQKCFQTTFDPRTLPGHNTILVEDSDEFNSD